MYRFRDTTIDTRLFLQMQDLAAVLTGIPDLRFAYAYGSAIDSQNRRLTASANWGIGNKAAQETGLKTDILLRTRGTLYHTTVPAMQAYMDHAAKTRHPKFASQLFTLFEDIRLEEIVKRERPGTAELFRIRQQYQRRYFTQQLRMNVTRGYAMDELYCLICLLIQSDQPDPSFPGATKQQINRLDNIKSAIFRAYETNNTRETAHAAESVVARIDETMPDMVHNYFIVPIANYADYTAETAFDELTRTDPLANDSLEDDVSDDDSNTFDESFSTWHSENENAEQKQNFMQFELEQGTRSSLLGEGARETEEGDQATASIQGDSGESEQNDYSNMEAMEKRTNQQGTSATGEPFGHENKHAVNVIKHAEPPSDDQEKQYRMYKEEIAPYRQRLSKTMEKVLAHKQTAARQNLVAGRLSKRLISTATDDFPRLFYKKDNESKEIDAAFTLLIDCSASMMNKMEETKKSVILFHDVLKELGIPHSIIGFWEEATEVKDKYKPNYSHIVHSFHDSLYQKHGANIMQLEAQEDNRDGFSIRKAAAELEARNEKNRFLLVFSDGQPAASDYTENGIIDTNQAVYETRRKNINVIGMFIAEGEISEEDDHLMRSIYGHDRMMVPAATELTEHFSPLLKKLLLQTM
ncbi:nitric oxide reductase activation protein NorD [Lentibacillus halophilus]|uniref:Nitric oxide reductase activation protein NorD n=1 Tax=Lentibacillus halophilus TaxID=295065 RepID=A0ABP3JC70_9BACI